MGIVEVLLDNSVGAAVGDMSPVNRAAMFEELLHSQELFSHLSQDRPLMRLAYGMHDINMEVRELAIRLIGKLSTLNRATVFPVIRRVLGRVLADIEIRGEIEAIGRIVQGRQKGIGKRILLQRSFFASKTQLSVKH